MVACARVCVVPFCRAHLRGPHLTRLVSGLTARLFVGLTPNTWFLRQFAPVACAASCLSVGMWVALPRDDCSCTRERRVARSRTMAPDFLAQDSLADERLEEVDEPINLHVEPEVVRAALGRCSDLWQLRRGRRECLRHPGPTG